MVMVWALFWAGMLIAVVAVVGWFNGKDGSFRLLSVAVAIMAACVLASIQLAMRGL
jgi:hypothetical protein